MENFLTGYLKSKNLSNTLFAIIGYWSILSDVLYKFQICKIQTDLN